MLTHRYFLRFVILLVSLLRLIGTVSAENNIDFVVGDFMKSEGGNWNPAESSLENPFGIDFDSKGNLFVVELGGGRVHQIDPAGVQTQIAGDGSKSYQGDGGPAKQATFNGMHNCAITNDDQLLIADSWNHCVRRIDLKSGTIETVFGTGEEGFSGDKGDAKQAKFNFVMCISLNHAKEVLHIIDLKNRRVRNVDLKSGRVDTVAGNGDEGSPKNGDQAAASPLVDPRAVASDSQGNLYILERRGNALRVVRPDGTIHTCAGTGKRGHMDGEASQAQFGSPKHICVDDQDNVYVADDVNGAIRKYDPRTEQVSTVLGRGIGHPKIKLSHPHGVCFRDGSLYVLDSGNHRILRLTLP
ncbi:MAG: hypothetical protein AB8B91_14545 [Rubripirellula sp.]